ncbi:hypothetical protein C8245_21345 [Paracidovorax avenae]|uniref:lipoprotein n=1 Tax=Paracidovorax avenae TaxID=80867 RepID=UPI000D20E297|nr:lipoprotein [Paracidovorax avenae]AVS67875.1 hypothetical protein C8245_21345 [Paracidovorax avenae]
MKRILFAAAAVAVLASCGSHGEAKDAIRKLLNDPESAQFTDLKNGKNKGDVCGMVNAKNRMGGYVGATPFFYEKASETSAIVRAPKTAISDLCGLESGRAITRATCASS